MSNEFRCFLSSLTDEQVRLDLANQQQQIAILLEFAKAYPYLKDLAYEDEYSTSTA